MIDDAIDRILNPEDYAKPSVKPITKKETIAIQELPLHEIKRRFPELAERIRDAVYEKCTNSDGFYCAKTGYRSKNKPDFHINHIEPMSRGDLTVLDNLQSLKREENWRKRDRYF